MFTICYSSGQKSWIKSRIPFFLSRFDSSHSPPGKFILLSRTKGLGTILGSSHEDDPATVFNQFSASGSSFVGDFTSEQRDTLPKWPLCAGIRNRVESWTCSECACYTQYSKFHVFWRNITWIQSSSLNFELLARNLSMFCFLWGSVFELF